jgi:hypothetical protein
MTPTCERVAYEYLCSNDGDRLSWRRRLRYGGVLAQGLLRRRRTNNGNDPRRLERGRLSK